MRPRPICTCPPVWGGLCPSRCAAHNPNPPKGKSLADRIVRPVIRLSAAILLLALAPTARAADDLFSYLQKHASMVGGVVVVDGTQEKLIEIRISDDFGLGGKFRAAIRVSLFSVARAGEVQPSGTIPTSLEEIETYSDAEAYFSTRYEFNPFIAGECLGGITLKTASIAGPTADPLDGTKLIGACGVRFSKNGYNLSLLGGHYGPVVEADKLAGFFPSLIIRSHIPLSLLGKNTAFVPDLAFGREKDGRLTRSLRLALSTRF